MIGVSSCLAGIKCRYSGEDALDQRIKDLVDKHQAVALCPELLAGLNTPRASCEIVKSSEGMRILTDGGNDMTDAFELGAKRTLAYCKKHRIQKVIFKDGSPSCGVHQIYDGSFSGRIIAGAGIVSVLLKANGIEVLSPDDFMHH